MTFAEDILLRTSQNRNVLFPLSHSIPTSPLASCLEQVKLATKDCAILLIDCSTPMFEEFDASASDGKCGSTVLV